MKYTILVTWTSGKQSCIGVFDTKAEAEAWNDEWELSNGKIIEIVP